MISLSAHMSITTAVRPRSPCVMAGERRRASAAACRSGGPVCSGHLVGTKRVPGVEHLYKPMLALYLMGWLFIPKLLQDRLARSNFEGHKEEHHGDFHEVEKPGESGPQALCPYQGHP